MSHIDFVVAIPARYASSRLPGKPLRLIGGDPMVVHVARRAMEAGARQVVVATDDYRISDAVAGQGLEVCMTASSHASGTDRLAECARVLGWSDEQIVVNLQGDEPFAPLAGIRQVASVLADSSAPMATLAMRVHDPATIFDPNAVKVVCDSQGHALYFSRAPIPWERDLFDRDRTSHIVHDTLRHIGIYAYRAEFLHRFSQLEIGRLERLENLEQLRVLEAGHRIAVGVSPIAFPQGVDTEADLIRAQAHWAASNAR